HPRAWTDRCHCQHRVRSVSKPAPDLVAMVVPTFGVRVPLRASVELELRCVEGCDHEKDLHHHVRSLLILAKSVRQQPQEPRQGAAILHNARMFDWNDLRYCLAVARHGSTIAAAKALNVTQSTVQRRLRELERPLGHK